jgi:choline dehydrogenase-like flavoprotein
LAASSQAQALLADLGRDTRKLEARGIRFGAARLAVQAQEGNGCVYCGQCIYGCPYGYIYNSSQTLAQLLKNPKFSYRSGLVVESVDESATEVTLRARTAGGESVSVSGERVFLACGVLSTARIILTSLGAYERPLSAADNCYFLLPLLRQKRVAGVTAEALHTLAQIFIEVEDAKIGPYSSHLQIYTYNDLFRQQIANSFGPLHGLGERLLLGRLLLIQGYLHSELSPKLKLTLRRGKPDVIVVEKEDNSKTRPALRALQQKLLSEWRSLRAVPVTPMLNVGKPGRGFHTGGTFPMRNLPSDMETDLVGRLHGFERLHLVDASVLPSLPATTITLSVMANAHRIGSEVTR